MPAIDVNPTEEDTEEGILPGSPQSSPAQKQALRESLATKSRAQKDEILTRTRTVDAALTSGHGLGPSPEEQSSNAETHRQVSKLIQEQKTEAEQHWGNTLRASRLLHEKVAQQLSNKASRRRAQRDVLKKWAAVTSEPQRTTRVMRMMMCCGCSSGNKKPQLLSERPMTEAAMMFNNGDWSEAMKTYDHALLMMGHGELGRQAEAHLVRCECLLRLKDYATMEAEADALLRTAGENWAGYRMRGTARFYLGKLVEANEDYELALRNKAPKGDLAGFVGPCSAEAEAAIMADREQLLIETGGRGAVDSGDGGGGGSDDGGDSEIRGASETTETRIGT
jgi:tetratricopeptide (TPR) repeat protein|eukprot:COSAG06_NODE_8953_length_2025_cov_4.282970_2_plen_337_part_00